MARKIFRMLVALAVALAFLFTCSELFGVPGIEVSVLITIPVVTYWLTRRLRPLAFSLLVDAYLLSYLLGGVIAAGAAIVSTAIAFVLCSEVTLRPQLSDRWHALWTLLRMISGTYRPTQLVRDGKVALPTGNGPFFGPALVVVNDGNAAVMEQAGKLTRIVGPGITMAKPWEFVRTVVDLTEQQEKVEVAKALTRDSIPLHLEIHVFYRVYVDPNALKSAGKHEYLDETIRRAVLTVKDWREAVKISAESVTRDVISLFYLDDLYDPREGVPTYGVSSPRLRLQREIRNRLNSVVTNWGIRVETIQMGRIEVPEEVRTTMLNKWQAEWDKQATVSRGEGEAMVYAIREKARAQAQVQMIVGITQAFQQAKASGTEVPASLVLLRFIEAMERLASDPATKILLSPSVLDTLQDMRQTLALPD